MTDVKPKSKKYITYEPNVVGGSSKSKASRTSVEWYRDRMVTSDSLSTQPSKHNRLRDPGESNEGDEGRGTDDEGRNKPTTMSKQQQQQGTQLLNDKQSFLFHAMKKVASLEQTYNPRVVRGVWSFLTFPLRNTVNAVCDAFGWAGRATGLLSRYSGMSHATENIFVRLCKFVSAVFVCHLIVVTYDIWYSPNTEQRDKLAKITMPYCHGIYPDPSKYPEDCIRSVLWMNRPFVINVMSDVTQHVLADFLWLAAFVCGTIGIPMSWCGSGTHCYFLVEMLIDSLIHFAAWFIPISCASAIVYAIYRVVEMSVVTRIERAATRHIALHQRAFGSELAHPQTLPPPTQPPQKVYAYSQQQSYTQPTHNAPPMPLQSSSSSYVETPHYSSTPPPPISVATLHETSTTADSYLSFIRTTQAKSPTNHFIVPPPLTFVNVQQQQQQRGGEGGANGPYVSDVSSFYPHSVTLRNGSTLHSRISSSPTNSHRLSEDTAV